MIVHISAEAEEDLESIADHIARDNPTRALSFAQELRAKCMGLESMAQAFPVIARYRPQGVRRRVHGNYLIFFREEVDRIVVLHVLHGAMDYTAILFPD